LASCVRTPDCECFLGYRGNGVASCELSVPVLTAISLSKPFLDGEFVVNATFSNTERIAGTGFCRTGEVIVHAESVGNGVMRCRIPDGSAMVAISFDGTHFSAPLRLGGPLEIARVVRVPLLVVVAVGAVVVIWNRSRRFARVPRNSDHELLVTRSELP
jgi:hypothetical protein